MCQDVTCQCTNSKPEMLGGFQSACRWHRGRRPSELPRSQLPYLTRKMLSRTAYWSYKKSVVHTTAMSRNGIDCHHCGWFTWPQCCRPTPGLSPYQLPMKWSLPIYFLLRFPHQAQWSQIIFSPSYVEPVEVLEPSGRCNSFLILRKCLPQF